MDFPLPPAPNTVYPVFVSNAEMWQRQTGLRPDLQDVAWPAPAGNMQVFSAIYVPTAMTVKQMFAFNGTVVSGNCDIGIAPNTSAVVKGGKGLMRADAKYMTSAGSTPQAGTSVWQAFNVADARIARGIYWLVYNLDNATGRVTTLFKQGLTTLGGLISGASYQISALHGVPLTVPTVPTSILSMQGSNSPIPLLAIAGVA